MNGQSKYTAVWYLSGIFIFAWIRFILYTLLNGLVETLRCKIQKLQNGAARVITRSSYDTSAQGLSEGGGGGGGGTWPGAPSLGGGGANFQNKNFFDKNNGLKKHFLNPNFTYIDLKKGLTHVVTGICPEKFFEP